MIKLISSILIPILGLIFKYIDDRNAAKKKYNDLVKKYQRQINIDYIDEEKEAYNEIKKANK